MFESAGQYGVVGPLLEAVLVETAAAREGHSALAREAPVLQEVAWEWITRLEGTRRVLQQLRATMPT